MPVGHALRAAGELDGLRAASSVTFDAGLVPELGVAVPDAEQLAARPERQALRRRRRPHGLVALDIAR